MNHLDRLIPGVAHAIKQTLAIAKQDGNNVEHQFVYRANTERLVARSNVLCVTRLAGMPVPLVKPETTNADRVPWTLVRPGDEPVK